MTGRLGGFTAHATQMWRVSTGAARHVSFAAAAEHVAFSFGLHVRVGNLRTAAQLWLKFEEGVHTVVFSPDGEDLFCLTERYAELRCHSLGWEACARFFLADVGCVAPCNKSMVWVAEETGGKLRRLVLDQGTFSQTEEYECTARVTCLSPNKSSVSAGTCSGALVLVHHGQEPVHVNAHKGEVRSCSWCPVRERVVSISGCDLLVCTSKGERLFRLCTEDLECAAWTAMGTLMWAAQSTVHEIRWRDFEARDKKQTFENETYTRLILCMVWTNLGCLLEFSDGTVYAHTTPVTRKGIAPLLPCGMVVGRNDGGVT